MAAKKQQPNKRQAKQPKVPTKKPLGPALDWDDNELEQMSQISAADLKAANALWQNEAPPKLKNLLQAKVQEEGQGNGK